MTLRLSTASTVLQQRTAPLAGISWAPTRRWNSARKAPSCDSSAQMPTSSWLSLLLSALLSAATSAAQLRR
jgi:hypothetical protein